MDDRLPPSSVEAEQGVLGCILKDPVNCTSEFIELCDGCRDLFYDTRHQVVIESMRRLYRDGVNCDTMAVIQDLQKRGKMDAAGGISYVSDLEFKTPSSLNLSYFMEDVVGKYRLRQALRKCIETQEAVYGVHDNYGAFLDGLEAEFSSINSRSARKRKSAKALISECINYIEQRHQNKGTTRGIATGFTDLDRLTSGMCDGDMIVLAARPSRGKTAIAMNIVDHVAVNLKLPVGVLSLEMTSESLMLRMLSARGGVCLSDIDHGMLVDRDFPKLTTAATSLSAAPIFIDDDGGYNAMTMEAKLKRMKAQHDIKLAVIDYLQLVLPDKDTGNLAEDVGRVSGAIKATAKNLKIPIIVLSQLNRTSERDKSKRPTMACLRSSGRIEQDADLVGLLYDQGSEDEVAAEYLKEPKLRLLKMGLDIAKQRNGPVGVVDLQFRPGFVRYESVSKDYQDYKEL